VRLGIAGLVRTPGRTFVRVVVLAAATALLGGMLLFVGNSLREMSASAVRSVPLDWQGPVGSYAQAQQVAGGVGHQAGVIQSSAAATAPLSSSVHTGAAGRNIAGSGDVLVAHVGYARDISSYFMLIGSHL